MWAGRKVWMPAFPCMPAPMGVTEAPGIGHGQDPHGQCRCLMSRWEVCGKSGVVHGMRGVLGLMQACKLTFSSYRLQPLGSYPRIADKKGSHDLFGPVNRLLCTAYDRAMVMYLACLKVDSRIPLGCSCQGALRKQVPVMPCRGGIAGRNDS